MASLTSVESYYFHRLLTYAAAQTAENSFNYTKLIDNNCKTCTQKGRAFKTCRAILLQGFNVLGVYFMP